MRMCCSQARPAARGGGLPPTSGTALASATQSATLACVVHFTQVLCTCCDSGMSVIQLPPHPPHHHVYTHKEPAFPTASSMTAAKEVWGAPQQQGWCKSVHWLS